MYLLTQNLPSGHQYDFNALNIKPLTFAQALEYANNCPKGNDSEKFYFDYQLVLGDDPNVDELLLCDLEYVIYFKQALSSSRNLDFPQLIKCPVCGNDVKFTVKITDLNKFTHIDEDTIAGITVNIQDEYHRVRMPKVKEFFEIFKRYRMYKRSIDLRIIKLISLFEDSLKLPQKYEQIVTEATYEDFTLMLMLEDLYLKVVEDYQMICPHCKKEFDKMVYEQMKTLEHAESEEEKELFKKLSEAKYGGVAMRIDSLVANFFWSIRECNKLTPGKVLLK